MRQKNWPELAILLAILFTVLSLFYFLRSYVSAGRSAEHSAQVFQRVALELADRAPLRGPKKPQSPNAHGTADAPDLDEAERIEAALLEAGYFREDVPLSFALQDTLHTLCAQYGIDYAAALGLIETESGFQTDAVSASGDYGLLQLNQNYFPAGLSPQENLQAGMGYLARCLRQSGGDLEAALTMYHFGHDNGSRDYAQIVLRAAERWAQCLCTI